MTNMNIQKLLVAIVAFCSLAGCSSSSDDGDSFDGTITRVLIVYMGGDQSGINSLAGEVGQKIDALIQGWDRNRANKIIIYEDRENENPSLNEVVLEGGNKKLKLIEEYTEENSASPAVLSRVIQYAKQTYPTAEHSMLVFSHGSGWKPAVLSSAPLVPPVQNVIIQDGDEHMEIEDFADAIPDNAFKYLILEACWMADVVSMYELRNKAEFILASSAEIVSPGFTHIYPKYLNSIFKTNLTEFAEKAFEWFDSKVGGWQRSATFSIIRTSRLEALGDLIYRNCNLDKKVDLAALQRFDRANSYIYVDLEDYYLQLVDSEQEREELRDMIAQCVIWKNATPAFFEGEPDGYPIFKHSGMTTYVVQDKEVYLNMKFLQSDWGRRIRGEFD